MSVYEQQALTSRSFLPLANVPPANAVVCSDEVDERGAEELVVVGAMSHMCVDAGVRAAANMGHPVTVIHDACATLDLEFGGV